MLYFNNKKIVYLSDDFTKATEKLRQAEDTSDLQSDKETPQRRKKPKKISFSSSDEEIIDRLKRPPKILGKMRTG